MSSPRAIPEPAVPVIAGLGIAGGCATWWLLERKGWLR